MSSTASSRISASALALIGLLFVGCGHHPAPSKSDSGLLYRDDFHDLANWHIEAEQPGRISASNGVLDIDVPAGVTLWFKSRLEGPLSVEFEATAVAEGGPNDQVSDLNVFWMANNVDGQQPVFAHVRSGKFEEYNALLTYYVGLGGNRNSTTRMRRYIGDPVLRPLRPGYDLADPQYLLVPNKPQTIRLLANGKVIEYWRDGTRIFHMEDDAPYENGWFGFRTTYSHLRISKLRIRRLP
jgi:hypothetical protein